MSQEIEKGGSFTNGKVVYTVVALMGGMNCKLQNLATGGAAFDASGNKLVQAGYTYTPPVQSPAVKEAAAKVPETSKKATKAEKPAKDTKKAEKPPVEAPKPSGRTKKADIKPIAKPEPVASKTAAVKAMTKKPAEAKATMTKTATKTIIKVAEPEAEAIKVLEYRCELTVEYTVTMTIGEQAGPVPAGTVGSVCKMHDDYMFEPDKRIDGKYMNFPVDRADIKVIKTR
jgi:hypothetical protein